MKYMWMNTAENMNTMTIIKNGSSSYEVLKYSYALVSQFVAKGLHCK
jgi:hypothetical protein